MNMKHAKTGSQMLSGIPMYFKHLPRERTMSARSIETKTAVPNVVTSSKNEQIINKTVTRWWLHCSVDRYKREYVRYRQVIDSRFMHNDKNAHGTRKKKNRRGVDEPDHGQKVLARSFNAENKHLLDPERELKPVIVLGDDRQGSERIAVKELVGVEPHKPVIPCGSQLDAVLKKGMKVKKGLLLDSTAIVCNFAVGFCV